MDSITRVRLKREALWQIEAIRTRRLGTTANNLFDFLFFVLCLAFFRVWNEIFLPLISRADRWWFSFHELCISIFLISRGRKYFLVLIILSLRAKGAIFITHRRKQKVRNRQKMSFEKESFGNFMLRGGLIFFLSLPRGHSCKAREGP